MGLEKDHKYPVAATKFADDEGKLGAVYLTFLSPQILETITVAIMPDGTPGGLIKLLISFTLLYELLPQLLYDLTFILSVANAAALL